MNSSSLLMIQLGAQSNPKGCQNRAKQTHITEIWKTYLQVKHFQKQMTETIQEEGVIVEGVNSQCAAEHAGTNYSVVLSLKFW